MRLHVFGLAGAILVAMASRSLADVKVLTSIKPLQSLAAAVMQGAGTPGVIVEGVANEHTFTLKPSSAQALADAQVIFWIGPELESFLAKPLESIGNSATAVSLIDAAGVQKLKVRNGNGFDPDEDHSVAEIHSGDEIDPHIWLDPDNAKAIVKSMATTLSEADAGNAALYQANATTTIANLDALSAELRSQLTPLQGKGFIVFHDAYQYFEHRFGIHAAGAISIHPENPPGAAGIAVLQERIQSHQALCVFSEPQFDNKLVQVITDGTPVKSGVLDPLGADLAAGPALYPALLRRLAASLVQCLS